MSQSLRWTIFALLIPLAFYVGRQTGIGNQYSRSGDSGAPKNCRALIAANILGFSSGDFTAEEALYSIDRNCGASGYIWNER
jgi:hypothetical protein